MRSPLRGLMTKKVAEIKRIIEDDPLNRKEILALHQQLKRLEQRVEVLNGKIETLLLEEEASEDLFSAELEGCDVYERMLTRMEVEVQNALESIATIQRERNGSTSALSEKRICKLPKLELLKFSGTLREWLPWWGQFERIHKDDTLSDVDKFHYLHQAVTKGSRAQKFLEGYTVTEANYAKAIEALQEKFGDKVLLTEMYVRQLLGLIVEKASSQRRTLADLYDPLMASLRSLESLEVTTDQNAVFLYPMVESSLPDDVLQIWQRRPEAEEIRGAERLEFVRAGFKRPEKMQEKQEIQRRTSPTEAHLLNQSNNESCAFCDMTNHTSRNCNRAKQMMLEQRRQKAAKAKVCFWCLGRRHMARDCRSRFKCFVCRGRHVELMCSRRREEIHEKKANVKEDNLEAPSTSMADQTCSSEVLLMIASARVASPRGQRIVRILFDSGSQRSYIRRALIGQLNLEKIGQGQIQKALFGGGMTGVEKHGIYRIQLENIRKGNKIGIDVLEEKTICNRTTFIPMGQWVEELISHHVEFNSEDFQEKEIDILIGSDYLGECLTGRTLKLKSGPTAIETIFGWILCGRPSYQGEGLVMTMITALLNQARIEELWDLEVLGIKDACSDKNRKEHDERRLSRSLKTTEEFLSGILPIPVEDIEYNREIIEETHSELLVIQSKIRDFMLTSDVSEEELEQDDEEALQYTQRYKRIYKKCLALVEPRITASSPTTSEVSFASSSHHRTVKLPKIELKKFTGEIKDWLGWWAQFNKIHVDPTLEDTDKFQYLVQSMSPGTRASKLVDSYPLTAENYPKVIETLTERFGRPELLQQVYVRDLIRLMIDCSSKQQLKVTSFYDELVTHLRALESLKIEARQMSVFIFPMIEACLSEELMKAWQRSPLHDVKIDANDSTQTRVDLIMEFLQKEAAAEQDRALAGSKFGLKSLKQDRNVGRQSHPAKIPTASGLFAGRAQNCIFCNKDHKNTECLAAHRMSIKERRERIKNVKCCFSCLQPGHISSNCRRRITECIRCKKKHLDILCPLNAPGRESADEDKEQVEDCVVSSTVENGVSFSGLSTSSLILLETLKIKVEGATSAKVVRALLDTGSQRSYILSKTAQDLGLSPIGQESLKHVVFGGHTSESVHQEYRVNLGHASGNFKMDYDDIFRGWLDDGIIEKVPAEQHDAEAFYLPHRPVVKLSSGTTPIRPVFDASSKVYRSPSLNDCLEKGPNLIEMIPNLMLRFRNGKFGVVADIKKAFLQIEVNERDRDYLRFLWYSQNGEKTEVFRHRRVVFGVNCSPFILGAVIEYHLSNVRPEHKPLAQRLQKSFYVDNLVTSVNSFEELQYLKLTATSIMDNVRMELSRWEHSLDVASDTYPFERAEISKVLAQIYDPIGFLNPILIKPKILLQKAWIKRDDQWGTFVGNRVKEICRLSDPGDWRYVPSECNPADLPSRGCSLSRLIQSRWWEGPSWLKLSEEFWPSRYKDLNEEEICAERKKIAVVTTVKSTDHWYMKYFSSFIKNVRMMAWIRRFINNLRSSTKVKGELSVKEIDEAELALLKLVQAECFPSHSIPGLKVCEVEGILRVKTKLIYSSDEFGFRLPVLLHGTHPLIEQMICDSRVENCHAGVQFLMNKLREKYWIVKARQTIKKIVRRCVTCRRLLRTSTLTYQQLMTLLCHAEAVMNGRPMTYVSDDPNDLVTKSPSVFLQEQTDVEFPECQNMGSNPTTQKLRYLSKLREVLKSRFRKEYLSLLVQRNRRIYNPKLQAGDVVLVGMDNKKRNFWPLAVIEEILFGRDGVNRLVKVKTAVGTFLRPIQKIYPLEISSTAASSRLLNDKEKTAKIQTRSGRTVCIPNRLDDYYCFSVCLDKN
ncbi:hypothetical protein LAZ67_10001348, partial [Cordylochernes scorpioides]